MLVYDITNEKSFDNIKNWIRNIEEVRLVISSSDLVKEIWERIHKIKHGSITVNMCSYFLQHASADVERMVLGNKCDVNDKRQVSKDRGEKVRTVISRSSVIFL